MREGFAELEALLPVEVFGEERNCRVLKSVMKVRAVLESPRRFCGGLG